MNRRSVLILALAAATLPGAAAAEPMPSQLLGAAGDQAFLSWLDGFYQRQAAAGWTPSQLAAVLSGLAPDPRVLAHNAAQPEFALPVGAYVSRQLTAGVISLGRRKRDSVPELASIRETFGVPADILTAIWGMESGFGANQGDMDVVRCLATLAGEDPKRAGWAEGELVACLKIVSEGRARRERRRGSWAGA